MPHTATELSPERSQVVSLGENRFDPTTGKLSGKNGQAIKMRSQTFNVLKVLLEDAGAPVSKSDLIDRVWDGRFVTDDSLTQCISELRKLLGDQKHAIIETFPKIGYQINADHVDLPPTEPIKLPTSLSVAVFPFLDISSESKHRQLGDALALDLGVALSKYCDFSIVGPSSLPLQGEESTNFSRLRDTAGVQYVVEGSQQKTESHIRVSASLIDTSSRKTVWANTYERDLDDQNSAQDDIVELIVVAVSDKIGDRLPDGGLSKNSAIHLSLRARSFARKFTREDNRKTLDLNQQAIEIEPDSPVGYIGLAMHYLHQHIFKWSDENAQTEMLDRGEYYADEALARGRTSEMALRTRGMFHLERGEIEWARQRFTRALEINPYDPSIRTNLAMLLPFSRQTQKAVTELEHVLRVMPTPLLWIEGAYAWILWMNGEYEKSLKVSQRQAHIPNAHALCLIATYASLGQVENAKRNMAAYLSEYPDHCLAREREIEEPKYDFPKDGERWLDALRIAGLPENVETV